MAAKTLTPDYISKLCAELHDTVTSGMSVNDGIYMLLSDNKNDPVLESMLEDTSKGSTFAVFLITTQGKGKFPKTSKTPLPSLLFCWLF